MNILLQPCSGKMPMEHFEDTVMNGVPAFYFNEHVTPEDFRKIKEIETDLVKVWGFIPNSRVSVWKALEEGDLVLFYASRRFFYVATVHSKMHNAEMARDLWGSDEKGKTWEYMFFIKEGKSIELPYVPQVLKYSSKHIVQGAQLLTGEKAMAMKAYIDEAVGSIIDEETVVPTVEDQVGFSKRVKSPHTISEAEYQIKQISFELRDQPVREKIKVAKMLVRNPRFAHLVKERVGYVCEICRTKPFIQKNGLPYAEAHHKGELAKSKIDHPDDMMCVCPTCHRIIHFGTEKELQNRYEIK